MCEDIGTSFSLDVLTSPQISVLKLEEEGEKLSFENWMAGQWSILSYSFPQEGLLPKAT